MIRNCPKRRKGNHEHRNKQGNSFKHKAAPADAGGTLNENSGSKVFGAALITSEGDSCWVIDSGASQQMTANREILVNYCQFPEPKPVAIGDCRSVNVYGYRQVDITMILGNKQKDYMKLDIALL